MTISGLVERTGVPRTSIHFYLREGLLPRPQKSTANRSLYTDQHVELLRKIKELKDAGRSLAEIKDETSRELAQIEAQDVDLVQLETDRTRKKILRIATEEFLSHGYDQTRVAEIIRKAGINSQILYNFFPSKGELLVESFRTFVSWNLVFVESNLDTTDPGERLLWRMLADARANEFGSSVLSLIRSEPALTNGGNWSELIEQAWAPIMSRIILEFESAVKKGAHPPVSLELLAYSLIGASHNASLRASWDDEFSREDVLATHLWLYMKVLEALGEAEDPDPIVARYQELIKTVAARQPASPPAIEE